MRNKVLVVESPTADQEKWHEALRQVIDEGGELYFASTEEMGLEALKTQSPHITFIESRLVTDKNRWMKSGCRVIFITEKQGDAKEECLLKPVGSEQILEKCYQAFPLAASSKSVVPPM